MSILLSNQEIIDELNKHYDVPYTKTKIAFKIDGDLAKAAVIHAVQYLEEPCTEHIWYRWRFTTQYADRYPHRYLCPDCMTKIKKKLGI